MHNYKDIEEYFTECSSHNYLSKLRARTLILHSSDDRLAYFNNIYYELVENSDNMIMIETSQGGHVSWFENLIPKMVILAL